MRNYFTLFCVVSSICIQAQIQQNINKPSGPASNPISEIDSIRFNAAGDEMQVVLQGGNTEVHSLSDIDSVTFFTVIDPSIHSCGLAGIHNSSFNYGTMVDQDGNSYKTIVIGNQEWMAENLKTAHFNSGNEIPIITDFNIWGATSTSASCWVNNDSVGLSCPYGKMYNWYAVADPQGLCPVGWRVPSVQDWNNLMSFLDPAYNVTTGTSAITGGLLRTPAICNPDNNASNGSGFSGVPAGYRLLDFQLICSNGYYWSSTENINGPAFAWCHVHVNNNTSTERFSFAKGIGLSVRCMRD